MITIEIVSQNGSSTIDVLDISSVDVTGKKVTIYMKGSVYYTCISETPDDAQRVYYSIINRMKIAKILVQE